MSAAVVGSVAIWAAIGLAGIAFVTGRRRALVVSATSGAFATLTLAAALIAGDFSLSYVAETTSLATPWPYRLAAVWGGMDGSMLFYAAMLLAIGAGAVKRTVPVRTVAGVGMGLLAITVFFANPFTVLKIPAVDGGGLLAILQHPAMIYHPPILYLGLTTLIVPFAITLDMILTGVDRGWWMDRARRWLYVSWTLLAVGMAAGASWAYAELGWGGFWAWDPVENTALMPWLAATVFLHASRIEDATGRWRRWNVMFSMLPFALSVMGVYLTRSGVTGSIHSFAEDPVVGRILLAAAAFIGAGAVFTALRSEPGEAWGPITLDRDGWLAGNALLLTVSLVFVTAGSAYPAFLSVFGGGTATVDSRYFVITVLPVAVAIAVSLAVSLRRSWSTFLAVAPVAAAVSVAIAGWHVSLVLLAPAAASVLILVVVLLQGEARGRRFSIHLAHLGMAVLLVGVAGSSLGGEFTGSMRPGEEVTVAGHDLALEAVETGEADRYAFARAVFDLDGSPISPEIRAYEDQATPVAEPALRSGAIDDVIVAVSLLFPDGETVEVSVFVRPLVTWVWAGAALIGLAGLVALFGKAGAASGRRRPATTGRRSGETTTGNVAR